MDSKALSIGDMILFSQVKLIGVSIELLDINERAISRIDGEVINGNISIDGDSIVRRVCNLTFVTTDENYKILETHNPLAINKKIKITITVTDLEDASNPTEEFDCGIYIMTKCTSMASATQQQITITGQDKMCLHNGEIGGSIEYVTRFDGEVVGSRFINEIDLLTEGMLQVDATNAESIYDYIFSSDFTDPMSEIYGQVAGKESNLENIIFSMVQTLVLMQQLDPSNTEDAKAIKLYFTQMKNYVSELRASAKIEKLTISEIIRYAATAYGGELPGRIIINDVPDKVKTPIYLDSTKTKIGYKMIPFIYPEELILNIGQPVSTVYEKCKEALGGNYEYFYDLNGNFVFQEIKNYLNNTIPPIEDLKSDHYKTSFDKMPVQFDFSKFNIENTFNNTPNWSNIRNDLYVWGDADEELLGYHLVIDDKPVVPSYVYDDFSWNGKMDWREYLVRAYDSSEANTFIGKHKSKLVRKERYEPRTMTIPMNIAGVSSVNGGLGEAYFNGNILMLNSDIQGAAMGSVTNWGELKSKANQINNNPSYNIDSITCRMVYRYESSPPVANYDKIYMTVWPTYLSEVEYNSLIGADTYTFNINRILNSDLNFQFMSYFIKNNVNIGYMHGLQYQFTATINYTETVVYYEEDDNDPPTVNVHNPTRYLVKEESNIGKYQVFNVDSNTWEDFIYTPPNTDYLNPYYAELKSLWMPQMFDSIGRPITNPTMTYYFDIIEGDKELSKFSVNTIGRRREAIEDKNIKQLYPTIVEEILVYYDEDDLQYTSKPDDAIKLNYPDDFIDYPPAGNVYKDAFSSIKNMLFKKTTYNEQLSVISAPVYTLDVNRRVYTYFEKTSTNGYYLVKKISLNLDQNGQMTTTLVKTEQRDN